MIHRPQPPFRNYNHHQSDVHQAARLQKRCVGYLTWAKAWLLRSVSRNLSEQAMHLASLETISRNKCLED